MRPITLSEIKPLQKPIQHFSDCYLVSSIGALARSQDGQKILSQNIAHRKDGFRIRFQNVNERREEYLITAKDMDRLILFDNFCSKITQELLLINGYNKITSEIPLDTFFNKTAKPEIPQNPIIKAIEIAMGRLIGLHPDKKPLVSRLVPCQEKFEYNKPSNFMKIFTGRQPIVLNESGIKMDLTLDKDKAVELLEKIDDADDFSFVAGTGFKCKDELNELHCYTIEGVNTENQYLQIFDCRRQESILLTFDKAIRSLKFLTGYMR